MHEWAQDKGVWLRLIAAGKPLHKAHIDSVNGRLRDTCLDDPRFPNLLYAGAAIET